MSEWISIKEGLPEDGQSVLIYTDGRGRQTATWEAEEWWPDGGLVSGDTVTHWMPLPEPPKEGEGK